MAGPCYRLSVFQKVHAICTKTVCPRLIPVRTSVYNLHFQEPTIDKQELSKPLDESDVRRFRPIKAAHTEHSTSVFYDDTVQKFINKMMKGGNKQLCKNIIDKTMENIKRIHLEKYHKASNEDKDSIECNPLIVFHQAIDNCKPILILTKVVKGGVTYQVPVPCPESYQRHKAMNWIIHSCRDKERKLPMENKLAWELIDAYNSEGKSVRKKQELHRQCEANKAYAHFRW